MDCHYALKVETRSRPPQYYGRYATYEEALIDLRFMEKNLLEGWKVSIVVVP